MLPVGKDTNVAFGGKNESVRVRKELFIQMCNISILWCSMQLFSCRVCFTREVTLQCAVLGGQCGCGLFVSWAWVEVVHSAAANQVSWASVLIWETVFTLQNDSGTNLRKYLVLGFFSRQEIYLLRVSSVAELNYCTKSQRCNLFKNTIMLPGKSNGTVFS